MTELTVHNQNMDTTEISVDVTVAWNWNHSTEFPSGESLNDSMEYVPYSSR